jgi:EPS I polysaccharide export inner membrane protein EpsE
MKLIAGVRSVIFRRLFAGATWSVIGTLLSQLLLMGMTALLSRLLPKSDFGLYMLVQTTMNMLGVLAGFGLGTMVTRYAAALKEADKERLQRILSLGEIVVLGFGLLMGLGLFGLSDFIASSIFHDQLSCGAMLFTTIDNYQKSVLIGFERLKDLAKISVVGAGASALISLTLASAYGVHGAALALSLSGLLQASLSRITLKKILTEENLHRFNRQWHMELPLLASFAIPALAANLLVPGALWASQAILSRTENGYVELALYGIAMQWFNALLFIPNVANKVLTPLLADLTGKAKHDDVIGVIKYALLANLLITSIAAAVFIAMSGIILNVYGRTYENGKQVLFLIALAAIFASLMNIPGNLLSAQSRMWLGSIMNFGWATVYIFASYLLTSRGWGATGLATGLLIAYTAHLFWSFIWMAKATRKNLQY